MKTATKHAAALEACHTELKDFAADNALKTTKPGYSPYLLTGVQVGSIRLLLHVAQRLFEEKAELQSENVRLGRELRQKEEELREIQKIVDDSISNL